MSNKLKFFLGIIFLSSSFFTLHTALAQTDYNLLAPIPLDGNLDNPTQTANTTTFLQGLVRLIIALAGVLAVIMIIFGGIKYISTESWGGKSDARETITNAIVGLLLAIGSWLILNTINPKLIDLDLKLPQLEKTSTGVTPSYTTPGPLDPSQLSKAQLISKITGTGVSLDPHITPDGVRVGTIEELINLKKGCGPNCTVNITSTTGGEHKEGTECTHVNGYKADISQVPSINTYITKFFPEDKPYKNGDRVFKSPTGATYVWETHPPSPRPAQWAPHWDVSVCN